MAEEEAAADDMPPAEEFDEPAAESTRIEQQPPPPAEPSDTTKTPKVQIDPYATVQELMDHPHCLTALPAIPEGPVDYQPMLYTFRVKPKQNWTLGRMYAKPPPFCVLLDHTIAVIWILFNNNADKSQLGISQLQWALHFLKTIYTSEGVHPRDIDFCINVIEEFLMIEYAQLSEYSMVYKTGDNSNAFTVLDTSLQPAKVHDFSKTYAEIIKKCPERPPNMDVANFDDYIMDMNLLVELQKLKKAVGIDNIDLTEAVSKEQAIDVLQAWKKEQIEKIHGEVERLHTVEDMMKNVEPSNFQGYTEVKDLESFFKDGK